jgi:beta-glucosidase
MFAALAAKAAGSSTFSTYGLGDALKNRDGMIAGHIKARAAIKAARASLPVGITLALTDLTAAPGGEALYAHVYAQARKPFYDAARGDDFVGVQSYTRTRVGPTGPLAVLVTENGIGTEDDAERIAYTEAALAGLRRCIKDGLDVRGYIHWSLMDNFEWLEGYRPKFGLVSVDRTTFKRTLKPSALRLAQIAKSHGAVIG